MMKINFKTMINEISIFLKKENFRKNSHSFYLKNKNNFGIIDFQISNSSNDLQLLFTINLGTYSNSLKVFDNFNINSNPTISDCHWKKRIGFLLPQNEDFWWSITNNTNIQYLISEIQNTLKIIAIPEIINHITDESLTKNWISNNSDGLTEQQMQLYLIALLKEQNDIKYLEKAKELLDYSKGKPFFQNIMENLQKLNITI